MSSAPTNNSNLTPPPNTGASSVVTDAKVKSSPKPVAKSKNKLIGHVHGVGFNKKVDKEYDYAYGKYLSSEDVHVGIAKMYDINPKQFTSEVRYTHQDEECIYANVNLRAAPSTGDKYFKAILKKLTPYSEDQDHEKDYDFVPKTEACSGTIHPGRVWPSNDLLARIRALVDKKDYKSIKTVTEDGSDYATIIQIHNVLMEYEDEEGDFYNLWLEVLNDHPANEFIVTNVRISDYGKYTSEIEPSVNSANQWAGLGEGIDRLDQECGQIMIIPTVSVASNHSVGQKEHDNNNDYNPAFEEMLKELPILVASLKKVGKKVIVLMSDPLRIHRIPGVMVEKINQVVAAGATIEFLSNYGEDIVANVKEWQKENDNDDDVDVPSHHAAKDAAVKIRKPSKEQNKIDKRADYFYARLGMGDSVDKILIKGSQDWAEKIGGLDDDDDEVKWTGKKGLLTKARSADKVTAYALGDKYYGKVQQTNTQHGDGSGILISNRITPPAYTTTFALDIGGSIVHHAKRQTAMSLAYLEHKGFIIVDTEENVSVKDGTKLYITTEFKERCSTSIKSYKHAMKLAALGHLKLVVYTLANRISGYSGYVKLLNRTASRGGCEVVQSWGVDLDLEKVADEEDERQESLWKKFVTYIVRKPERTNDLAKDLRTIRYQEWNSNKKRKVKATEEEAKGKKKGKKSKQVE